MSSETNEKPRSPMGLLHDIQAAVLEENSDLVRSTILPSIKTYTGVPVSSPICRARLAARRSATSDPTISGSSQPNSLLLMSSLLQQWACASITIFLLILMFLHRLQDTEFPPWGK